MVFDFIKVEPVTAVLIAAVLMILTGCFRNVEAAYKTINWETIVLFAAMLPMSLALEKTGVSEMISGTGLLRPPGRDGRCIFHYITDDYVHKQYSDGCPDGPYSLAECHPDRCKPGAAALRSYCRGQHVLRFSVLHSAQRLGNAGGPVHIYGLCQGGSSASDYYGCRYGLCAASHFPVLTCQG